MIKCQVSCLPEIDYYENGLAPSPLDFSPLGLWLSSLVLSNPQNWVAKTLLVDTDETICTAKPVWSVRQCTVKRRLALIYRAIRHTQDPIDVSLGPDKH